MSYKYVEEDQTVTLGSGKMGDIIHRVVVVPSSEVITGQLKIQDGGDTAMPIYDADSTVLPVSLELDIQSENSGGWKVTTGAGITAIIIGEW